MSGPLSRRTALRAGLGAVAGAVAGCSRPGNSRTSTGTSSTGTTPTPTGVGAETVATGFTAPLSFDALPGGGFLVADQPGRVYRVDDGGSTGTFLDLRDRVVDLNGYDERGLLGIAAHPDYAENGRLFVRYSAPPRTGTPDGYDHTFVLAEFRGDGDAADPDSERTVLEIPEPQSNHNAGSLAFGPDGYLYVGVGDGGGGNDVGRGHVEDWYDAVPGGNGQDVTENLLGSILRIDVDSGDPYAIPDDNPLVDRPGLDEQYAWGFRNPWRFSFDGDRLLVADVGQSRYEEVSVVEKGGNYGWNVREGAHCFRAENCPRETPEGDPLVDPVVDYAHDGDPLSGVAVIGGYVYRRDEIPELAGQYVFADWQARGRLFLADPDREWRVGVRPMPEPVGRYVLAFGLDADGDLYVLSSGQGGVNGSSGAVHRLVPG